MANTTIHEPLFHISKRNVYPKWYQPVVYLVAIVTAIIATALVCLILFNLNPVQVVVEIFNGNFGTEKRIWLLLRDACLLLLVGLALVPAFKMKFWNLGGNGQILMGCLATVACMKFLGEARLPDPVIWIFMIIASISAGIIWAVIPAIFKAKWNTNESLFTLMMNYIATYIVALAVSRWGTKGSGDLKPIKTGNLPVLANDYLLIIIVAIVVVVFMFFYLKNSKHGFEVALVGESKNTARYVGINVKKIIIRTLVLSGAICGLVGLLLSGAIDHKMATTTARDMGFTAILVVWFAKSNPLMMVFSAFGVTFITKGMEQVNTAFSLKNDAIVNLIVGLVFFIIIACEFFIIYKINKTKKKNSEENNKKEAE